MVTSQFFLSPSVTRRLLLGLVAVFLVGCVIQIFGPLRVDTDVGFYLSIAASFADGYGLNLYGEPSPLPVGYPILIGLLDRAGLAGAHSFVILNLFFLVGAALLLYRMVRAERGGSDTIGLSLVVLLMSSFVIIKYFPRARSEMASLLTSWAALLCIAEGGRTSGQKKLRFLLAGAVLAVLAISVRASALALIPAFVWAWVPHGVRLIDPAHRRRSWCLLLGGAALLALAVFWLVMSTSYVQDWMRYMGSSPLKHQVIYMVRAKLYELGQLALNMPVNGLPVCLRPYMRWIGVGVGLFIMFAIWSRRRNLSAVDVFVLGNLGILMVWPGYAIRFWLPILPFLAFYACSMLAELLPENARSIIMTLYLVVYVSLGIGVQVVMTREAFSKDFALAYGDGSLAEEYQAVVAGPGHVAIDDQEAFRVLVRYHGHVSPEWDKATLQPYSVPAER